MVQTRGRGVWLGQQGNMAINALHSSKKTGLIHTEPSRKRREEMKNYLIYSRIHAISPASGRKKIFYYFE
jgi:hypothetical protein